jgi:hypothetical protein
MYSVILEQLIALKEDDAPDSIKFQEDLVYQPKGAYVPGYNPGGLPHSDNAKIFAEAIKAVKPSHSH